MIRAPLVIAALLMLAACRAAERPSENVQEAAVSASQGPCEARSFEGARFTVCSSRDGKIEIHTSGRDGQPYRTFNLLGAALGERAGDVAFAMNAGMFDSDGDAIGLLIEDGEELHAINRRNGSGNFHLLPNGIFLVRDSGRAEVVPTPKFKPSPDIAYASQSGPMLVIDGKLHPKFDPDGESRHIRNGVGIGGDGTPLFVISADPVSFGKFARFFRDELGANNALYFDGAVSSLWEPQFGRMDLKAPLGPMVVVFRPSASAPGREGRATP